MLMLLMKVVATSQMEIYKYSYYFMDIIYYKKQHTSS